ncbi:hypothetical protein CSUI_004764 [Cystoisospora suis]|uniref:Uncharacterized protein n=1 Tax=Cystoisospora suis TaxID=483139 RepID=A0A2C6KW51_9APIC|nr:hypothetical protein CSUI_004764 [Cystoisospora suis]
MTSDTSLPVSSCPRITKKDLDLKKEREEEQRNVFAKHTPHTHSARLSLPDRRHLDTSQPSSQTSSYSVPPHSEGDEKNRKTSQQTSSSLAIALRQPSGSKSHLHPSEEEKNSTLDKERESKDLSMKKPVLPLAILLGRWWGGSGVKILKPVWIASTPRMFSSLDYNLPIPFPTSSRVYRQPHPVGDQSGTRLFSPFVTSYGQQPQGPSNRLTTLHPFFYPSARQWNPHLSRSPSPSPLNLYNVSPSLEFSRCFPSSKKSLIISSFHLFQFDSSLPRLPEGGREEDEEEASPMTTTSSRSIPTARFKPGERTKSSITRSSTHALPFQKIPIDCFFTGVVGTSELKKTKKTNEEEEEEEEVSPEVRRIWVTCVTEKMTRLRELIHSPSPLAVLCNPTDELYILPYIDDGSQAFLLPSLPNLSSSSLHRLLVCAALWTRVKETRLPADVFILQMLHVTERETEILLLSCICHFVRTALLYFIPDSLFHSIASVVNKTSLLRAAGGESLCDFLSNYSNYRHSSSSSSSRNTGMCFPSSSSSTKNPRLYPVPAASSSSSFLSSSSISPYDHVVPPQQNPTSSVSESRRPEKRPPRFSSTSSTSPSDRKDKKQLEGLPPPTTTTTSDKHLSTSLISPSSAPPPHVLLLPSSVRAFWLDVAIETAFDATSILQLLHLLQLQDLCLGRLSVIHSLQRQIRRNRERLRTLTLLRWENQAMRRTRIEDEKHIKIRKGEKNSSSSSPSLPKDQHLQKRFSLVFPVLPGFSSPSTSSSSPLKRKKRRATDRDPYTSKSNRPRNSIETRSSISSLPPRQGQTRRSRVEDIYEEEDDGDVSLSSSSSSFSLSPEEKIPPNIASRDKHLHKTERHRNHLSDKNGEEKQSLKRPHSYRKNRTQTKKKKRSCFQDRRDFLQPPSWRFISNTPKIPYLLKSSSLLTPHDTNPHTHSSSSHHHPAPPSFPLLPCCSLVATALCRDCLKLQESELPSSRTKKKDKKKKKKIDRQLLLSPSTQLLQQEAENNTRLFSKQTENHQLSSSALPCNLALSIKPLPSSSRKEHRMENDGNKDGDSRREAHEERSNSLLSYMRDGEEKNGNDGAEPSHQGPSQNEEQEGEEEEEVFLSNSSSPAKRRNAGAGEGKEEDEEGKSFYRDDDVQDEKANTGCLYTREKHQDDCEEDFEAAGYSFPSFVTLDNEALKPQGEEREHDIYDQMKEEEQERHEEQEEAEDKLSCLSRSDEGSEPEERNLSPPQSFFDVPPISIATESRTSPHAPPENRSEVVERINSREEKEVIGEKKDDMKTSCVDSSKVEREGDSSLCPSNEEDEQGRNLRLDQLLQEKKDNNPSEETKEASEEKQEENVDENQERIDGGGTQEERSVTKIADDVYEQNKKPRFYDGKGSEETERRRWRRKEQKEHIEEEEKRRSLYPTPTEGQFLTSPLRAGRPPPSLPSSSSNFPSVSGNPPQLGKNDFPHPSSASSSASSSSSFSSLPLPMTCSSSSFSLKDKKGEEVDQNGGARCSLRDQQKAGNLLDSKTFTCPPSSSSCVHTAAASPLYTESHSSSEGEEEKGIRGEEHGVYFSSSWSSSSFSPTTSSLEPTTSEESTDSLSKEHTDTSTDTASSSPSSCFSHSHRVHRSRKPQDRQMSSFSSSLFIENHLPIYFTVCTADLLKGCSPHAQGSGIPHNPLSLHKQNTVANRGRTNTSAPPDVYCYNCGHGFHFSTYLRPSEMQGSGKKKKKKEKTKKRINKGRPFALLLSKGRHEDTMRKSEALWLLEEDDWATVEDSLPNQTHERRSGASLPKRRERKKAEEVSTTSYREEANTGEQASMESRGRIETEKESEEKREVEDERDDVFFMERKWQQEEEEKKKKEEKEEERDSMTEVREVSDPNQGDGYVSPSDQRNRQGRSNHSIRPSTESILHHYIHILDETGNTDGVLLRVSHQNLPPGLLFQAPLLTQQQRWKILERLFACRDSDLYARAPPSHMNSTASLSFTSTGDQVKKNTADSSSCSPLGGWEREGSTKDLGWSDGEPRQRWVRMNRFLSLQEKEAKENKDYRENALEEEEEKEKKMQDSWRQAKNRLLNIETTLRDTNIVRQATAIARCHSAVPSIECKEAHWYHFLDPPPPSSPIFPSFSASLAAFYQRMPGHKEILSPTFEESFFSCIFRVYLQLPRSSAHALWTHLFPFHFPTRKTLQRTKVLFLKVQRELKKRTQSMLDVPREEESAVSGNKRNDRSKTEIPSPSPSRHKSDSDTRRMKVDHDADKRTGKEDAEKAEGNAEDSNRRGGGERRRKVEGEGLRLMKEEEEAEEGGEGQEEDQITIGERKGDASYYKIGRSPYTSRETNSTRQTTETSRSTEEDLHKKEKEKEKRKSMKKSSLELAKVESEKNALWCLLRATAEAYARLTLTVKCQDLVLGNYYHNVP